MLLGQVKMKTISRLFWKLFHVNKSLLVMYLEMSNNLSFFFFLRYYSSKFRFTEWKSEFPGLQNGNQNFPVYGMEKNENFQFSFLYLGKKSSFHSRKRKISSFHSLWNYPRMSLYENISRIIPFTKWNFGTSLVITTKTHEL